MKAGQEVEQEQQVGNLKEEEEEEVEEGNCRDCNAPALHTSQC